MLLFGVSTDATDCATDIVTVGGVVVVDADANADYVATVVASWRLIAGTHSVRPVRLVAPPPPPPPPPPPRLMMVPLMLRLTRRR